MKTATLMIKPSSSLCNLRCAYCFYHELAARREVASYGVMKDEVLEALVRRVMGEVTQDVHFVFQGGEPLVAGLSFFERFEALVAQLAPRGLRVMRSIQTNGTLVDEDWAAFFARHRYLVGVSLDGPAALHNDVRPTAEGKGSFSGVMAGIRHLRQANVEFNILTVVTREVAMHGAKVYSFLRKNGFDYLQFIPCMDEPGAPKAAFSLDEASYGRFLIDTFALYERELLEGKRISVRFFDNLIGMLAGYPPESCGMSGCCACHLVVEADGGVYPCDFYVTDAYRLGSVQESGLEEMVLSDTAMRFIEESTPVDPACHICPYAPICRGGGCRRYREPFVDGKPRRPALCEAYRMFFGECLGRMQALARRFVRR